MCIEKLVFYFGSKWIPLQEQQLGKRQAAMPMISLLLRSNKNMFVCNVFCTCQLRSDLSQHIVPFFENAFKTSSSSFMEDTDASSYMFFSWSDLYQLIQALVSECMLWRQRNHISLRSGATEAIFKSAPTSLPSLENGSYTNKFAFSAFCNNNGTTCVRYSLRIDFSIFFNNQ